MLNPKRTPRTVKRLNCTTLNVSMYLPKNVKSKMVAIIWNAMLANLKNPRLPFSDINYSGD